MGQAIVSVFGVFLIVCVVEQLKGAGDLNLLTFFASQVWPGQTVFPDYTSKNCTDWWVDEYERFYKEIKHDALWIVSQLRTCKMKLRTC